MKKAKISFKLPFHTTTAERMLILSLWPVILSGVALVLIGTIWLPISSLHGNLVSFYFGVALLVLCALALFAFGLYFIHKYANSADKSLQEMKAQLESFKQGDITLLNSHHYSASLDELQDTLNQTISTYASYRLSYAPTPEEEALWARLAKGEVLSQKEFEDRLPSFVQNNHAFLSALLFVQSLGNNAKDEVAMGELKNYLIQSFPGAFLGCHGLDGYALYLPKVDSYLALKSQCEEAVTHYRSFGAPGRASSQIAYCKIGGALYPYVSLPLLSLTAQNELEKSSDVSLKGQGEAMSYPHYLLSEENKKSIDEAYIGEFTSAFEAADSFESALRILKDFGLWVAGESGFEGCGLLSFHPESEEYKVMFESEKENGDKTFTRLGNHFSAAEADPFYEQAKSERGFFASSLLYLPSSMRSRAENLGLASFLFEGIAFASEKRGLLYFVSKKGHASLTEREQFCLASFVSVATNFLVSFQEKAQALERIGLLESLCERGGRYVYSIDKKSHKIAFLSHNLAKAFPQAQVGDFCYKALRGNHEVCPSCPLLHGVEKRVIEGLGASELTLSPLRSASSQGLVSILIESASKNASSLDNRFLDPALQIKNKDALLLDLARSLKTHESGFFVSLSLLNSDDCLKKAQGLEKDSLMGLLSKNIQDAGYGDFLYRLSDYSLGFLLKEYPKNKLNAFVEEIAEVIRGPLAYEMAKLDPEYAFSALAYPSDAQTSREIFSLAESELLRSQGFGTGYLVLVADNHPRKALREDYVDDLLEKSLAREVMPIAIQPVVEAITQKVVSADILARLYGDEGDPIPLSEFFHAAEKKKLLDKIDLGSLWAAGKLAEDYGEAYFSKSSLSSLCLRLSPSALADPDYLDKVKRFCEKYKLPKEFLHFIIENADLKEHWVELEKLMKGLSEYGVVWEDNGVNPENVDFDLLAKLGITRLRSELTLISRAVASSSDYTVISRFVTSAVRGGYRLHCTGVESKEEKEVAEHLGMAELSGFYFSKALSEKDFIQFLAYGK